MSQLEIILKEQDVAVENAKQLIEAFGAPFTEAGEILQTYRLIKVEREDDFDTMAEAREKRLALKKIRTGVENKRKELKADIVKAGKAIDSVAKFVKETIEPAEQYLESQEKYADIKAAERAAALKAERIEKLAAFTNDISMYNFETMTDEQFDALIAQLKAQKEAEAAAAAKAEADRKAAEEAERKRQAEVEAENAKLKAEAEAREAEIAKQRAADEAKLAAERAEQEKKLAAERAAAESERQKREALEAEQRAKEQAEARAKADAEEAERQSLLAPDKEKIVAFANALNIVRTKAPAVKTAEAQELLNQVDAALASLAEKILAKAKSL